MQAIDHGDPHRVGLGEDRSHLVRSRLPRVEAPGLLGGRALRALRDGKGGAVSAPAAVPEPEKYTWKEPRDREVDVLALVTCGVLGDYDAAVDLVASLDDAQRVSAIDQLQSWIDRPGVAGGPVVLRRRLRPAARTRRSCGACTASCWSGATSRRTPLRCGAAGSQRQPEADDRRPLATPASRSRRGPLQIQVSQCEDLSDRHDRDRGRGAAG